MKIIKKERPADLYNHLRKLWLDARFDNIAGSVQLFTEKISCQILQDIHSSTGVRRFVMSGGIAMNIKMNMAIADLNFVDDLFVPGSGSDESLPIGGCYLLNARYTRNTNNKPLCHLYLGYDASHDNYFDDLSNIPSDLEIIEDAKIEGIADLLATGHIIARITGRCEFGARALGNRSILADPSRQESVKRINEAIKNRDFWMPFAISILNDKASSFINNPKNISARFMSMAFDTEPRNYNKILAGTHLYDHTVRPQFVYRETNPEYYDLISAFDSSTGIPALLNTSFNLHGEPIVNTIEDALTTFINSGIDYLFINDNFLIKK